MSYARGEGVSSKSQTQLTHLYPSPSFFLHCNWLSDILISKLEWFPKHRTTAIKYLASSVPLTSKGALLKSSLSPSLFFFFRGGGGGGRGGSAFIHFGIWRGLRVHVFVITLTSNLAGSRYAFSYRSITAKLIKMHCLP